MEFKRTKGGILAPSRRSLLAAPALLLLASRAEAQVRRPSPGFKSGFKFLGVPGGGGGGSTFNSGRLGTPGLVLSPDLKTVTSTSNDVSVDGTTSKTSGLSQVAFLIVASSGNFPMVGVGNIGHPIDAAGPGYLGVTVGSIGLVVQGGSAGTRFFNGSIGADGTYIPTPSVGDWVALALDMTGGTPSIRWRSTPMSGWTNPVTLTGMTGPLFYSVSPDTGTIFTVDPTSANIPLDTGYSAWG